MNKLTNFHAAPAPLHGGGAFAAATPLRSTSLGYAPGAAPAKRGLRCSWTKDAAGHLVCVWTDADAEEPCALDQSNAEQNSSWRGLGRAGAALARAA